MSRIVGTTGLLIVLFAGTPWAAADEQEASQILERAIKAHGGEEAMLRAAQSRRTDTGLQAVLANDLPFVSQVTRSLPERVRLDLELDKKISTTLVLDGTRGWQKDGTGPTTPLPSARVRELREEAYVWWLATLVPLTKPGFTIASIPGIKVDGEATAGLRVTRRGYADAKLYFNVRNGLLTKIERRVAEGGREVDKEYLYANFREFQGATLPTKEIVKVNGNRFTEMTISNYSFPEKLGAGAFGRP